MRSSLIRLGFAFLPAFLAACGSSPTGSNEATGSASVAITQVPKDVKCIEIDVAGLNSFARRFDVITGSGSVYAIDGLPLGGVDVSGSAWNSPCIDVGAGQATWTAQPMPVTITAGVPANVTLTFYPTVSGTVGVDFAGEAYRNVTTLAGLNGQLGNTDGVGSQARFQRPEHVVADGQGNLFVTDGVANTIRQISIATGAVTTIAGNPGVAGSADGVGPSATFNRPMGITTDGNGHLFVVDLGNTVIRRVDVASKTVTTFAGTAGAVDHVDGVGAAARFMGLYGITTDGKFLYASDNDVIRKIDLASAAVTTLAPIDGRGNAVHFTAPGALATDGVSLYVGDGSAIVYVALPSMRSFPVAGDPTQAGAGDGPGGHLTTVTALSLDQSTGDLFIADASNSNIRVLDASSGVLKTVAGTAGVSGEKDGFGPDARFRLPLGVTVDAQSVVYVTDAAGATVRKITK